MSKATSENTTKPIEMDFIARTVMALAAGVLIDDQQQILAAAQALADECGIAVPDFAFAA